MPLFCYKYIDEEEGSYYVIEKLYKHQERPQEIEVDGFVFKLSSHTPARLARNWGSANFGVNGTFNKALQKTVYSDKEYEDELRKRNLRPATLNDFDRYESEVIEANQKAKKLDQDMKACKKLIQQGMNPAQANQVIFGEQERKQLDQLQGERQQGKVNPELEKLANKIDVKKFKIKK